MFNTTDIELARSIVEKLPLRDCLGWVEDDENLCNEIAAELDGIIDFESDFYVTNGVSKVVIDIEKLPFVIKFPFDGMWRYDEEEDEDYFIEYCGADSENGNNYCEAELKATEIIQENGYGYLVPDMMFLCVAGGRPFYIQERVCPYCDFSYKIKPSNDSLNKAKNQNETFNYKWRALVFDIYGEETFNEFMKWAREYAPDVVSDMHSSNYGIDMAGRPVIFDISGFHD